ncbi:Uncharacterised protein [Mycobacterium tuberculosis]|nr:Uncharacterised protein [Mycobacterium tuberculosis]
MVARHRWRTGVGAAVNGAGHHAPHIGVHHRHPLAVSETRHRARGVAPDARQGDQDLDIVGHHVIVVAGDDGGALV